MDQEEYSDHLRMVSESISADPTADLAWELEAVSPIITMDEPDISLELLLLRASVDHHSDMVNISLSSLTTMAMRMMISEMRILMRAGVSSEMMMNGLLGMHQRCSHDLYARSILSTRLQNDVPISAGIYNKIRIILSLVSSQRTVVVLFLQEVDVSVMSKHSNSNDSISDILTQDSPQIVVPMMDSSIRGYVWRPVNVHDQQ